MPLWAPSVSSTTTLGSRSDPRSREIVVRTALEILVPSRTSCTSSDSTPLSHQFGIRRGWNPRDSFHPEAHEAQLVVGTPSGEANGRFSGHGNSTDPVAHILGQHRAGEVDDQPQAYSLDDKLLNRFYSIGSRERYHQTRQRPRPQDLWCDADHDRSQAGPPCRSPPEIPMCIKDAPPRSRPNEQSPQGEEPEEIEKVGASEFDPHQSCAIPSIQSRIVIQWPSAVSTFEP